MGHIPILAHVCICDQGLTGGHYGDIVQVSSLQKPIIRGDMQKEKPLCTAEPSMFMVMYLL